MHSPRRQFALRLTGLLFAVLWLFIGAVSAVDAALTIRYAPALHEQNPLAAAFIRDVPDPIVPRCSVQDVSLLIGAKMFGTLLVLGFLVLLYRRHPVHAQVVVATLSVFQLGLLLYLFH